MVLQPVAITTATLRRIPKAVIGAGSAHSVIRGRRYASGGTDNTTTTGNGGQDISAVFPSLQGVEVGPLDPKFAKVQERILEGRADLIQDAWDRLLPELKREVDQVKALGNKVIPEVNLSDITTNEKDGSQYFPQSVYDEIRKRGSVIIRNVVPREESRQWKYDLDDYISKNPVKGFPADSPTVYELYWTKSQLHGRSHPNVLKVCRALQNLWYSTSETPQPISLNHPLTYADRLRIRLPDDKQFALGPHMDAGSIERWEDLEYSNVYKDILYNGKWEEYEPFDYTHRLNAKSDLHDGQGQCSMFRFFQGWLSISETGPHEGTLKVNPLLKHATAYVMLRPFFAPETAISKDGKSYDPSDSNMNVPWKYVGPTSVFPNSLPGAGQELSPKSHPHLELEHTMVSIPKMYPGDFVAWHTDEIHAVENEHNGAGDASVLYIPAVALTQANLDYLVTQRDAFLKGSPAPDFPNADGPGEHGFTGVGTEQDILSEEGLQAMGLGNKRFDLSKARSESERIILERANDQLYS